ncbi:hypothetical protein A3K55_01780 [Candidatus Shapirobacteria bacterium RBG_13_44_7]|uniref:DUF4340 domain-containing protein n=1 Tax=Candidatus Shapirobacteria bacterium RBG_13_44_7 TaxID=1802149 RepID=A0A1F7SFX7_9BACT|nr:MAG: hypothetical protein A3K55_01780 [Candidatus Shapirobacteria bacterium RBG_13_44_7]
MKEKLRNPVVISGFLVLLLGLVVVVKEGRWKKEEVGVFFPTTIEKFCLNQVCLYQENQRWMVNDGKIVAPGNKETIEGIIERLREIKLTEMVSNNPDRFGDLGIGGEEKIILTVGEKKLEIGELSTDYSGTYVREEGGGVVYKISAYLDGENWAGRDYWEEKMMTNLAVGKIKKVTIVMGKKERFFEAKEGKWANERWINKVASLAAEKFLNDFNPEKSLVATIKIESEGENINLSLGRLKNVYWASTEEKYFFQISRSDFDLLTSVGK